MQQKQNEQFHNLREEFLRTYRPKEYERQMRDRKVEMLPGTGLVDQMLDNIKLGLAGQFKQDRPT